MIFKTGTRLDNDAFDAAERTIRYYGLSTTRCAACHQDPHRGEEYEPPSDHDCAEQLRLLRLYCAANVPRKLWTFDLNTAEETCLIQHVRQYLDGFDNAIRSGLGLSLLGPFGSGKTTAAVEVVKHALKHGKSAYVTKFSDVINGYQRPDAERYDSTLRQVRVLLIDEVAQPFSDAQAAHFSMRISDLIDARYSSMRLTLTTGNLSERDFERHYPAAFSRLRESSLILDAPNEDLRPTLGLSHRLAADSPLLL